jgi:putative phosphoribosyl transferase
MPSQRRPTGSPAREIHIATAPIIDLPEPFPTSAWVVLVAHDEAWREQPAQRARVVDILHGYGFGTRTLDVSRTPGLAGPPSEHAIEWRADRLQESVEELRASRERDPPRIGAIGVGEAAAAVLLCAAKSHCLLAAVACLDGRRSVATDILDKVRAPTLLIAGSDDLAGLTAHRSAVRHLQGSKRLEIIPGSTASFDAPGAIDTVAHLAGTWFTTHLTHGRAY